MDRNQLTLALTLAIMMAMGLGWVLREIYGRLSQSKDYQPTEVNDMQEQLYAFERTQSEVEKDMEDCRTYALQMKSERDAISDELGRARHKIMELQNQTP